MMLESDNVLAEVLGRNMAIAAGREGSASEAQKLVREKLQEAKISVTGLVQADVSGMSLQNRVTARTRGADLGAWRRIRSTTSLSADSRLRVFRVRSRIVLAEKRISMRAGMWQQRPARCSRPFRYRGMRPAQTAHA